MEWTASVTRYFVDPPYGRSDQWPEGWQWIGEHLFYTAVSVAIAIVVAIPTGLLLTRKRGWAGPVIGAASIIQTIPSLAMIALLFVLIGHFNDFLPEALRIRRLGPAPSIIALVAYAVLPILRNIYTGIDQVNPAVREAASAMGMSNMQILFRVELPLAMPVIMAGIRTATVWTVGIAAICALVGAGGLGTPIFRGLRRYDNALILVGVIPAMILALGLDALFAFGERKLTPRGLRVARKQQP